MISENQRKAAFLDSNTNVFKYIYLSGIKSALNFE